MSKLAEIMQIILDAEKSGNLPEVEDLRTLISPSKKPKIYKISVDLSKSIEKMVEEGKYDLKNDHTNSSNFQIKGEGKLELNTQLVHFNQHIFSEDVLKELNKKGLRPATIDELLAFGAQYPEEQRKFTIVALGSSCEIFGYRFVPTLDSNDSRRSLDLDSWGGGWPTYSSFLAIAK